MAGPTFVVVLLARVNADISLADFEIGVRNLVSDTERHIGSSTSPTAISRLGRSVATVRSNLRRVHALYVEAVAGR